MKQVKRILRENTTVDTQTGEVLQRETTVQFSKEPAYVKLYFDCLGTYIKNDGLSESCNDLLVEVLKHFLCRGRSGRSSRFIHPRTNLQSDSQEPCSLETSYHDMDKEQGSYPCRSWRISSKSVYFRAR